MNDKLLTVADVAAKLGIAPGSVIRLIRSGDIPAEKFAGSWLIRSSDLDAVKVTVTTRTLVTVAKGKPGRPRK